MNIFIAGICGTFMAGIAQLARDCGHRVRGCDANPYPPMSTLLAELQIPVAAGYDPAHFRAAKTDLVIIGNALSRGNPLVEAVLDDGIAYCSGAEFLRREILQNRCVIAVAGTHGKTTTSSIIAWLLHCAEQKPGFLIGGRPGNFSHSAELGTGAHFVVEADEYDTAFFDKRAKFVHYLPRIAVLNNLEFDHADIYADLAQIQTQFHHLVRTIPSRGQVVVNADDPRLAEVLDMGCWSEVVEFSAAENAQSAWRAEARTQDGSEFAVLYAGDTVAEVAWQCVGTHNMQNALAALVAAHHAGVPVAQSAKYLATYQPVARRLQRLFHSDGCTLYDDFAHHPTAIARSLDALRARHPNAHLTAIVELRSNTMRMLGQRAETRADLAAALARADCAYVCGEAAEAVAADNIVALPDSAQIIAKVCANLPADGTDDIIVTMSNGGFESLPQHLCDALGQK